MATRGQHVGHRAGCRGVKRHAYNYFDSKATLFSAFVEQCACEKMPLLFSRIDEGANLTESLEHLAVAMIRLLTSPLSLMLNRIIISEAGNFPELAETFWKHGPQKAINILSVWLMQHNDSGVLNIPDPVLPPSSSTPCARPALPRARACNCRSALTRRILISLRVRQCTFSTPICAKGRACRRW